MDLGQLRKLRTRELDVRQSGQLRPRKFYLREFRNFNLGKTNRRQLGLWEVRAGEPQTRQLDVRQVQLREPQLGSVLHGVLRLRLMLLLTALGSFPLPSANAPPQQVRQLPHRVRNRVAHGIERVTSSPHRAS